MAARKDNTTTRVAAEARARADEAVRLRARGLSFAEIGSALGITRQAAARITARELDRRRTAPTETTERLRRMEAERLTGQVRLLHERVEMAARNSEVADVRTIEAMVKVSERLSRLLGLDTPVVQRTEATVSLGADLALADMLTGPDVDPD